MPTLIANAQHVGLMIVSCKCRLYNAAAAAAAATKLLLVILYVKVNYLVD